MATATPIGTNTLTAVTRRHILPEVHDQVYRSNPLFMRAYASNRVVIQGGLHIEVPLFRSDFASAGWYEGFDTLDTTPQDVLANAAWAWKFLNANVTFDGPTLLRNDSPESIANLARQYFDIARMKLEDMLGTALFSTGADVRMPEGFRGAIDDGTTRATYGGIGSRTTANSFWQPSTGALDTTTATLTLAFLQSLFMAAVQGQNAPTIICTTKAIYNTLWGLLQPQQRFPTGPGAVDEQLASAGFTNLLFNNVPVVEDSHCTASHIFGINERVWDFYVHPQRNFDMGVFQRPVNQDAYVAPLWLTCGMALKNIQLHFKATAITG